jgi:hypothetical protein
MTRDPCVGAMVKILSRRDLPSRAREVGHLRHGVEGHLPPLASLYSGAFLSGENVSPRATPIAPCGGSSPNPCRYSSAKTPRAARTAARRYVFRGWPRVGGCRWPQNCPGGVMLASLDTTARALQHGAMAKPQPLTRLQHCPPRCCRF